ncbi:class B sortase [Oscillibacter sp.]|uniref:class B sortase n=1 Tax=Oscillibacter sp. TaxID=1945593 RepID=UPI0033981FBA
MKRVRKILIALLAVVFVSSAAVLIRQMIQYREGEETYSEAEELAGLPDFSEAGDAPTASSSAPDAASSSSATTSVPKTVYVDPYADALADMDFSALREVNGDVLGWILIPGTRISYPLVQGTDNEYYLTHTWKKWNSVVGAVFLEYSNSRDLSDFNTIIYGHRMNDGSMFAGLKYYKQKSYYKSHPCVYITDDSGARKYDIFAAYEVSTQGDTYRIGQQSDSTKQAYIDYCLAQSLYDTGVVPTVSDKIVTLSTCTGNGHATRWVIQARLQGTEEEEPSAKTVPDSSAETSAEPDTSAVAESADTGAVSTQPDSGASSSEQGPDGAVPASSETDVAP